jgi:hypothetical protein
VGLARYPRALTGTSPGSSFDVRDKIYAYRSILGHVGRFQFYFRQWSSYLPMHGFAPNLDVFFAVLSCTSAVICSVLAAVLGVIGQSSVHEGIGTPPEPAGGDSETRNAGLQTRTPATIASRRPAAIASRRPAVIATHTTPYTDPKDNRSYLPSQHGERVF